MELEGVDARAAASPAQWRVDAGEGMHAALSTVYNLELTHVYGGADGDCLNPHPLQGRTRETRSVHAPDGLPCQRTLGHRVVAHLSVLAARTLASVRVSAEMDSAE